VAYVKGGPFWRKEGEPEHPEIYRAIVAALKTEYGTRRGLCVTVCPKSHPEQQETEAALLRESGFIRTREIPGNAAFLVKLNLDASIMRASLSQKWRYNLGLAEKNGLKVSFRDPLHALPDFYALINEMIARKRFISRNISREALDMLPCLFRQLQPRRTMLANVERDGKILAAAIIVIGGDVAHYLYGASSDAAPALRAGYVLHWQIARRLAEAGLVWYDLGEGAMNPGLRLFKQGLVGREGVVLEPVGEFDYAVSINARLGRRLIYALRTTRDAATVLKAHMLWTLGLKRR
jgi:lipid II:glycine glycyltransferase (peptidoglycan interpeptide bridge formation enzyme)